MLSTKMHLGVESMMEVSRAEVCDEIVTTVVPLVGICYHAICNVPCFNGNSKFGVVTWNAIVVGGNVSRSVACDQVSFLLRRKVM